jgi:hypothetical protein
MNELMYIIQPICIFNVTKQDAQKKIPDDDVYTSKHVAVVKCY